MSSIIGLYTAVPVARAVTILGGEVHLVCRDVVAERARHELGDLPVTVHRLEDLEARTAKVRRFHDVLITLRTSAAFSSNYRIKMEDLARTGTWRTKLRWAVARRWPSWPDHEVNLRIGRAIGRWLDNQFPTQRVCFVSPPVAPHLLCARNLEVVTLLESWDHAAKRPFGYPSRMVVAWNESIAEDWRIFQEQCPVVVGYPWKLRSFIEDPVNPRPSSDRGAKPVAMYAATATEVAGYRSGFKEELELVMDIAAACEAAGWGLLIKPKPNGAPGEFDLVADRFRNVSIGSYHDFLGAVDYYLDDDYNEARRQEVQAVDLVISWGTTFALDAALLGAAVLQLDLRTCSRFPDLARMSHNYHLEAHILDDPELTLAWPSDGDLRTALTSYLQNPDGRAELFRDRLARWVMPVRGLDDSAAAIAALLRGTALPPLSVGNTQVSEENPPHGA